MTNEVTLALDRGDARGLVEHIEQTFPHCPYPMRLLDIGRRLEELLGEPRPYPKLPRGPWASRLRSHSS